MTEPTALDYFTATVCLWAAMVPGACAAAGGPVYAGLAVLALAAGGILLKGEKI